MARTTRKAKKGPLVAEPGQENTRVEMSLRVIGRIHTGFIDAVGTPIQPVYAQGAEGRVIVDDLFASALDDIEGFERVWLVYWMDRVTGFKPRVVPYRDTRERGLFATRSPCRPNPIGMSVVRLDRIEGNRLYLGNLDILDGTPLLDIKPYVPDFDAPTDVRTGWLEAARGDVRSAKSDDRFR